ncbi:MAG: helix-turn-helix transcriptional regulator, partial [Oscillospiraceae bacterium]
KNEYVSLEVIDKICNVLECKVGEVMEHIPDTKDGE